MNEKRRRNLKGGGEKAFIFQPLGLYIDFVDLDSQAADAYFR